MVDWNGLLKWSTQYHDSSSGESNFKAIDEDRYNFLVETLEEYSYDEVKRIKQLIEELQKEELGTQEDEDNRIAQLEELESLMEAIDRGMTLQKMGGLGVLIRIMLESKYEQCQILALGIFGSINQNCSVLQDHSIQGGAFKLFNLILNSKSMRVTESAVSSLSMLVRGENLEVKRHFISCEGIQFLEKLLREKSESKKIRQKCLTLLKDLVVYDEKLDQTYSNLEKFSNTNNKIVAGKESILVDIEKKKKEEGLTYDQNEDLKKIQFLEQNKKFKHITKKILAESNFIAEYWPILEDLSTQNLDNRASFIQIVTHVFSFLLSLDSTQARLLFNSTKIDQLKKHKAVIRELDAKDNGLNTFELQCLEDLIQLVSPTLLN